jgi:glutamate-1-semialdehyde aminotransferase
MEGLPPEIQADRDEAWSCFYGSDFRAAVIMGRAAIQRAVRRLDADAAGLKAELNDLLNKGVITKSLKEWADEVRIAGDEAAHPEDLGAVNRDEAHESLTFMDAFLDHAIALPAKRDARKAARKPS